MAITPKRSGFIQRVVRFIADLLPDGGIGRNGPPPDVDGRRDTDTERKQAVLRAKSQWSSGGMGTTSWEDVERDRHLDF